VTTYLLDTDIAIELLRGHNVQVAEQLASRNRNAIFLSTVRLPS
jgi:predicted nucleic acid-binding protein